MNSLISTNNNNAQLPIPTEFLSPKDKSDIIRLLTVCENAINNTINSNKLQGNIVIPLKSTENILIVAMFIDLFERSDLSNTGLTVKLATNEIIERETAVGYEYPIVGVSLIIGHSLQLHSSEPVINFFSIQQIARVTELLNLCMKVHKNKNNANANSQSDVTVQIKNTEDVVIIASLIEHLEQHNIKARLATSVVTEHEPALGYDYPAAGVFLVLTSAPKSRRIVSKL